LQPAENDQNNGNKSNQNNNNNGSADLQSVCVRAELRNHYLQTGARIVDD
jgi:hypothetical protein